MLKRLLKLKLKTDDGAAAFVSIKPQSYAVEQKLKIIYAQYYRKLVTENVATKSAMLDLLKKENIWTEVDEDRFNTLIIQISMLEALLESCKDDAVKQKDTVLKLARLRNSLLEIIQVKTEPMEFTAETIAEEIKNEHYIIESTFYDDGRKYFKDYDDFKARRYDTDVMKICEAFMQAVNISNTKTLLDLPENKWLMNNGFMNKRGEITNDSLWKEIEEITVEKALEGLKV